MTFLKKLQKLVEAVNTYYAFALLAYAVALYAASHTKIFLWVLACGVPLLLGWGGYLLRSVVEQRIQRHGFTVISDNMIYEIGPKHTYTLRYTTKLQAAADHLMVYPIGYQWSGSGVEGVPKLINNGQELLVRYRDSKNRRIETMPYEALTVSTEGNWHYWFIAFNPPVHKGKEVEIKYTQTFQDKKITAKPYLYYFVRTSMKTLELSVKFPPHMNITEINGSYIKPSDPNRPYNKPGMVYDKDKQWATWTIQRPKRGYSYRIDWQ